MIGVGRRGCSFNLLLDADEVDDEDQRRVRRDRPARALRAVAEVRRDDQLAPPADLHALHALVPAGDDLAGAEREAERLPAIPRRVELLAALVEHADVLDGHGLAGLRLRTG